MPYQCAKAVCSTFCCRIAGALIPIFGPDFPSLCIPPDAPDYGRMVIEPRIIHEATREAEIYRRIHVNSFSPSDLVAPVGPRHNRRITRGTPEADHRLRIKPRLICDSPYTTDTDGE